MADFEDLRLCDLLQKFNDTIEEIYGRKSLSLYGRAGRELQAVYDFFVTAQKPYDSAQETFKSLFSSFNYGAVIVNNALKCGGLSSDDNELLGECFEIMLTCCKKLRAIILNENI